MITFVPFTFHSFPCETCLDLSLQQYLSTGVVDHAGNSSNGLPTQLQGAWWQDDPNLEVVSRIDTIVD